MEIIPQEFVMVSGDAVVTDSRIVCQQFGKNHKDVLRAIRRAEREAPDESARRNFALCHENNGLQNGKPQPYYLLTKDAFMAVALAFTGKKAAAMRWAFIRAFNRMADFIRTQAASAWEAFNAAYLQHVSDKRHVSHCARDMRRWRDVKPQQLEYLERLHPQMPLLPN